MTQEAEETLDELLDAASLAQELYDLKVKYERLKDGHRKLVIVNQNLEDKLLQGINRYETEKFSLIHSISSLNLQLEELQRINQRLLAENERFKMDISVAIQLLHCKPSSFSSCKLENLPPEFQTKAKFHMQQESPRYPPVRSSERKAKVIRVPISAFPSTTVIYSIPTGDDDDDREDDPIPADTSVPASAMAKVLEERQRELHCQIPNGREAEGSNCEYYHYSPGHHSSGGLHPSRSMSCLGDPGHRVVDHGTQTYPNFIGEREKTRRTCIYCQGSPSNICHAESSNHAVESEPKVYVYTESETTPMTPRNSGLSNRRKGQQNGGTNIINRSSKPITKSSSVETDI